MRGTYCCSLILCFLHHSSHNLCVRMGSIQNPRAVLGSTGDKPCPCFLLGGNLCLRDCWALVLPWPKQTCWWCIVIDLLDHPNLVSILVSPVQDHAIPQSPLGDFKSSKKLFYCLSLWELT